ncbi:MAG: RNA polymerase sigma factor, partial [Saprospiraceae bacterium]|nr:RNA polymerase sigma factor [Saprospiraceae bacterium]
MVTDKKIISGCAEGDRVAQRALYDKYAPTMYAICLRYSKDRYEAEDILHDAFMKVYLNMKDFRNEGSFEGWIKRIVINTALNHKQKTKNNSYLQNYDNIRETEILDDFDEDEDNEIDIEFTEDELVNAIQELPCGYRT